MHQILSEGTVAFPSSLYMTKETIIQTVAQEAENMLSANPAHFLVEVKIKPTNNIKVYIDGDVGIGIDDLVKYNRTLYKALEEKALYPDGDFSLEVSSAGLDEPLKLHRQYVKNIGRDVKITFKDEHALEGKLVSVSDSQIILDEEIKKKGNAKSPSAGSKKTEIKQHIIPVSDIKTTHIIIKF
ncbi:MAG TPA: ribosome maturation factor [Niabella sp.]|nr:ribosome maturation factor [Niabella sp.]